MARRRVRHVAWRYRPAATRARIKAAAARLPLPNPADPRLLVIARQVALLQQAVHGTDAAKMLAGRFTFLGRTVDFGSLDTIEWRRTLDEDSSPLWRLTLAYFGWVLPVVAERGSQALPVIARTVEDLDRVEDWSQTGIFRDLWNPYTASHRLINLLSALALCRASGAGATPEEAVLLKHVQFCAAYIAADLETDLQLNHLLKNYVALAVYAAGLPDVPPEHDFLEGDTRNSVEQLLLDDGGHAERSPMYHALGLIDLRLLRDSGACRQWSGALDRCIASMERALACLSHPDGDIALFNDAWLGGAPRADQLELPGLPPGRNELPASGYVRLAGADDCIVFDRGPLGPDFNPAHGHADYLAIEASLAGQRFIVDYGTATYVSGELRDRTRSAASHNGPRYDGKEPAEFWKSFRVGRRARAGSLDGPGLALAPQWAAGWQDGYGADRQVRRWIGLFPGAGFIVADHWGPRPRKQAVSSFLVAEPWRIEPGVAMRLAGPLPVTLTALAGKALIKGPAAWWPRYGEQAPATALELKPDEQGFAAVAFVYGEAGTVNAGIVSRLRTGLAEARPSTAPAI